jgi:Ca2+-binding EF-hand superfamily protein
MPDLATNLHRQRMKDRFYTFDVDHSGAVTVEDFDAMARRILAAFGLDESSDKGRNLIAGSRHFFQALAVLADTDRDGSITEAEWLRAAEEKLLNKPQGFAEVVRPFSSAVTSVADIDNDGQVPEAEWAKMLQAMGADGRAAQQWARRLDTDGDGIISVDQLMASALRFYTSGSSEDPFIH